MSPILEAGWRSPRRINGKLFSFTEDCLRDYHINIAELRRRREYLEAISDKSPSEFSEDPYLGGGDNTCKVERTLERIDEDPDMIRLRKRTEPITYYLTTLGQEEYTYITLRYFKRQSWSFVADSIGISISTAKGYWRNRLVVRAAELLLGKIV